MFHCRDAKRIEIKALRRSNERRPLDLSIRRLQGKAERLNVTVRYPLGYVAEELERPDSVLGKLRALVADECSRRWL